MNNRVVAAFAFGFAVVLAAYVASDFGAPTPKSTNNAAVDVVAGEAPKRQYIQTIDSNDDGVPDWQEELVDGNTLAEVTINASSSYTPPDTMTGKMALTFFESFIRNKSYGQFGIPEKELVNKTSEQLVSQTQDKLFTLNDIAVTSDNSPTSLRNYGNNLATVILGGPDTTGIKNELDILEAAVANKNENMLKELDLHISGYQHILDGFLVTAVPSSLVKEHLDLVNSVNAILVDIEAMQKAFTDPVYTLIRSKRYLDDVRGLGTAFINLNTKMKNLGVTYSADEPAAQVMMIK